ncbi:MAG: hypothetical protein EZS28_002967 [Streblomastix strix]|uniref:Uncharacterized protein n=1 Tax=Streblomastix strix TaxID=222440 RepID=A0A5J4X442_9EUKA|nr:MAG: hypothetical protein EZS28_002967 [Streblomastix strix]
MADGDLHMLDVVLKHDEMLYGSTRYNIIGLVEQVTHINNQINNISNGPAGDTYSRPQIDEMLNEKADKSDILDTYSKQEADEMLNEKADTDYVVNNFVGKSELIDSYTKNETDALLDEKVNEAVLDDYYSKIETYAKIEVYNKTEVEAFLDEKADIGNSYSKSEDDALLLAKADKSTTYTKSEDDALLLLKANVDDVYDKTETFNMVEQGKKDVGILIENKADRTDLDNYVDLSSAQTISGAKQFGVISATTISKLTKNDASILLAGGGDMLVSSLVNQPQLQEVRDIATGRSRGYVFNTLAEMNNWMAIPDNVANLVIGDNLYIVDSQVTDYWWDGTQLRELETQLPDLTNVVTTLGTATGNGNAITDLSITGNTITPAKNMTFVNTDYDQNISGSKLFTSTIHSYGINYQGYDNSSVFLAGGGVRSIADIQSNSYSKSEDDALLLLKADKTQLIDAYSKTETNNLLNNKADTGVSYSKSEDDALLLLKADKTQLIDAYSKSEDDALLLLKADVLTTYDKTKIDEMIQNKVDNQTLVNLVNTTEDQIVNGNKTFTSNINAVGFAKTGKDNTSILLAGGGDILLSSLQAGDVDLSNYYTKTQDDALLLLKADKSTTYTKTETDNLLDGKLDNGFTYSNEKIDDMMTFKADTDALADYVTLGTAQTITASKTFQNSCRFIGTINGMSTVTGTSFIKSGADDSVVLLGAGGTKPISEFVSAPPDLSNYVTTNTTQTISSAKTFNANVTAAGFKKTDRDDTSVLLAGGGDMEISEIQSAIDLSNYYTKTQTYSKTETDNLLDDKMDSSVLDNLVNKIQDQTVGGYKTFALNVTAAGFAKSGKDDTSVLLAGGGDMQLSLFGGAVNITNVLYDNPTYLNTQNFTFYDVLFYKIGTLHIFSVQTAPIITLSNPSVGIVIIPTQYQPINNYQFSISGYQNNIISSNFENSNVKVNIVQWSNMQILRISGMWVK